jgi:hypothetical protein
MDKDLMNQTDLKWIKSVDLLVNLPSLQNGIKKEAIKYRQEIWDCIQYRESLVRWPLANEKIKMRASPDNRAF